MGSLNKINKAFARFEQEHERTPSPEELASELELPKEKVTDTLRVAGRHVSVDALFSDGEDNSLLDVLVNHDSPNADRGLISESLSTEVDRALETLTERERDIIKYFFGIGCSEMTLEEIGEARPHARARASDQGEGDPPAAPFVAQQAAPSHIWLIGASRVRRAPPRKGFVSFPGRRRFGDGPVLGTAVRIVPFPVGRSCSFDSSGR